MSLNSVPFPDLRIVPAGDIYPHETHDPQRSEPLIERIRQAEYITNPPIVAEMGEGKYVVLDGANRHFTLCHLGYEHILVQVANYADGFVDLGVWQHVVSDWSTQAFTEALYALENIEFVDGWQTNAVAHILMNDGPVLAAVASADAIKSRNTVLRKIVKVYRKNAKLFRTPLTDPTLIWSLYPDAIALLLFPSYQPEDIIEAAQEKAFLPPGVSRHIINGRALKLYYPFAKMGAKDVSLEAKNAELKKWMQEKLAERSVRFYAESTYQFDE